MRKAEVKQQPYLSSHILLYLCFIGVRECPGLSLFHLPLCPPPTSLIPAPTQQEVATDLGSDKAFACQRVGNKSHKKSRTPNFSEMSEACWGTLSETFTKWHQKASNYKWDPEWGKAQTAVQAALPCGLYNPEDSIVLKILVIKMPFWAFFRLL